MQVYANYFSSGRSIKCLFYWFNQSISHIFIDWSLKYIYFFYSVHYSTSVEEKLFIDPICPRENTIQFNLRSLDSETPWTLYLNNDVLTFFKVWKCIILIFNSNMISCSRNAQLCSDQISSSTGRIKYKSTIYF